MYYSVAFTNLNGGTCTYSVVSGIGTIMMNSTFCKVETYYIYIWIAAISLCQFGYIGSCALIVVYSVPCWIQKWVDMYRMGWLRWELNCRRNLAIHQLCTLTITQVSVLWLLEHYLLPLCIIIHMTVTMMWIISVWLTNRFGGSSKT